MTDGILLAETHSDRELRAYDTIIVDEAHERSLNIDFLLGYLKRLVVARPELKVIVTSATIDTQRFSEFFGGAPVIEVSGRTYPVEVRYRPEFFEVEDEDDEPVDMNEAIAKAVDEIARESRTGDILVFLPGEREIREAAETLRKHHPKGTEILPLFSRLSAEEQDRVFEPASHRRIVLATNVAETSLTVPGIHFVIDTGLARVKRFSPRQKIDQLRIEPISQAAAQAARGTLRPRGERHRHPPLRRGGPRGAPGLHHARDPAHLARQRDPAHGRARAGRDRGLPVPRAAHAPPGRGRLPQPLRAGRHRREARAHAAGPRARPAAGGPAHRPHAASPRASSTACARW